jgi:hypothetical protein
MPRTVLPAAALVLAALLSVAVPAPSNADDQAVHHVKYTISAENPVSADIYYRDTEPPTWADYSHNPYAFSPKVRVDIGPDDPWVLDVTLSNPDEWAMVTATSGLSSATTMFHCDLAVDGAVVDSSEGPKGALCSLRHW